MSEHDQSRKFVDKSAASANDVLQAERSAQAIEQSYSAISYSATVERMRDYKHKMIEMAQANTAGVFEFARQLSAAKSSFDLVELWTRHAKTQTGILGEQIKELAELGQEFAGESAAPIARSFTPVFKKPLQKRASDGDAHSLSRRCEVSGRSLLSPNRESIAWPRRTTRAEPKVNGSLRSKGGKSTRCRVS